MPSQALLINDFAWRKVVKMPNAPEHCEIEIAAQLLGCQVGDLIWTSSDECSNPDIHCFDTAQWSFAKELEYINPSADEDDTEDIALVLIEGRQAVYHYDGFSETLFVANLQWNDISNLTPLT